MIMHIVMPWCSGTSICWGFRSTKRRPSSLPCMQSISYLRMEMDSVSVMARLTNKWLVSAGLSEAILQQNSGPSETFLEVPGSYGISNHTAWIITSETTLVLASWLSYQMGKVHGDIPSDHHSLMLPHLQSLEGLCVSTERCALSTIVQAFCHHDRCFQYWLGHHVQPRVCWPDPCCIGISITWSC